MLTQGPAGLDFVDAMTDTCVSGHNYVAGDTCTVDVTFTPTSTSMSVHNIKGETTRIPMLSDTRLLTVTLHLWTTPPLK